MDFPNISQEVIVFIVTIDFAPLQNSRLPGVSGSNYLICLMKIKEGRECYQSEFEFHNAGLKVSN